MNTERPERPVSLWDFTENPEYDISYFFSIVEKAVSMIYNSCNVKEIICFAIPKNKINTEPHLIQFRGELLLVPFEKKTAATCTDRQIFCSHNSQFK